MHQILRFACLKKKNCIRVAWRCILCKTCRICLCSRRVLPCICFKICALDFEICLLEKGNMRHQAARQRVYLLCHKSKSQDLARKILKQMHFQARSSLAMYLGDEHGPSSSSWEGEDSQEDSEEGLTRVAGRVEGLPDARFGMLISFFISNFGSQFCVYASSSDETGAHRIGATSSTRK